MKKRILIFIIVLTSIFLFSDATSRNMKMIASIPNEKIYLYSLREKDALYQGMILSIDRVNKFFDWESLIFKSFPPELYYLDVNNDDKKELVVMLIENKGTGTFRNTVHIINPKNFYEYDIKNALDIIKENIKIKILSEKEVDLEINNIIYNVKIEDVPPEFIPYYPSKVSKIFFKNYIEYYMIDNMLKANVKVETRTFSYLGDIIIDYSFKNSKFKANKIVFEGNPTTTVTTRKLN